MEKEMKVPYFFTKCASPCYYPGNSSLRNIQAPTPPFTDIHDACLHEGTFTYEHLFGCLTVYVSLCTTRSAGVNMDPVGQDLEKKYHPK